MKRLLFILLISTANLGYATTEVGGIRFEDQTQLAGTELLLNGAGMRAKLFIKAYAMGLYLSQKKSVTTDVLNLQGPKRIEIVALRELTAKQFADALVDGIRDNHSEAELEQLKGRVETFKAVMLGLKPTSKGTAVLLDWLPQNEGGVTRLTVNGEKKGPDVPGEDFYRALLKIWLGDKPVAHDLMNALLGKT